MTPDNTEQCSVSADHWETGGGVGDGVLGGGVHRWTELELSNNKSWIMSIFWESVGGLVVKP